MLFKRKYPILVSLGLKAMTNYKYGIRIRFVCHGYWIILLENMRDFRVSIIVCYSVYKGVYLSKVISFCQIYYSFMMSQDVTVIYKILPSALIEEQNTYLILIFVSSYYFIVRWGSFLSILNVSYPITFYSILDNDLLSIYTSSNG